MSNKASNTSQRRNDWPVMSVEQCVLNFRVCAATTAFLSFTYTGGVYLMAANHPRRALFLASCAGVLAWSALYIKEIHKLKAAPAPGSFWQFVKDDNHRMRDNVKK